MEPEPAVFGLGRTPPAAPRVGQRPVEAFQHLQSLHPKRPEWTGFHRLRERRIDRDVAMSIRNIDGLATSPSGLPAEFGSGLCHHLIEIDRDRFFRRGDATQEPMCCP